jgi:hypothetical protein
MQQAPAAAGELARWIAGGAGGSDLPSLEPGRILRGEPLLELNVI